MKKLMWILGGLFFAFVVALVSIPLFVDVDQYRPMITDEANKQINGKLELGHLKLSLWGAIKIHADSIKLSVNGFPEPMVETKDFYVEIPLMSLLNQTPEGIAVLESPKISIVKELNGKMNALELMKKTTADATPVPATQTTAFTPFVEEDISVTDSAPEKKPTAAAKKKAAAKRAATAPLPQNTKVPPAQEDRVAIPPAPLQTVAPATPAAPSSPAKVPQIIAGAKIGLRIKAGDVHYVDKVSKSDYQVNGLDLDARNIGLGSTMDITLKAPVKGSSPTMTFEGPITAETQLSPVLVAGVVKSVRGRLDLDATALKAELKGGAFRKPEGMAMKVNVQLDGNENETLLRALDIVFSDYKLHGKGRVVLEPMSAKVDLTTDPGTIRLEKLQTFVPLAEPYQLKGLADFNANIDWKPEALKVNGDLKLSDGSFYLKDTLKTPMQFRLQAGFSESSLNVTRAALSGPETELELVGTVKNFLAPQFSFSLTGKSFNVDKTVVLPSKAEKTTSVFTLVPEAYADAPDVNPMLAMAKNPMFAGAAGTFTAQIAKVIAYGNNFEQVTARLQLQAMTLKILDAGFRTFGGTVKSTGQADLKSPGLAFGTQGTVAGINAKEAFKTYFPKYERTFEGLVDANWNITGAAFPAATRIRSLKGGAKLMAKEGAVKSVDFQDSINSAMSKVPFLKDQKPLKIDNGFKTLTAEIKFDNGTIHAEPIEVLPRNQGLVVKGKSSILESLEQETLLDVYDPQNQLPKELANPGKPAIALRIYGPITAPKTDYEYTVKRLASTAGKNVLKDQALKALGVESKPGESDQDKLKKAADQLRKKFGF